MKIDLFLLIFICNLFLTTKQVRVQKKAGKKKTE